VLHFLNASLKVSGPLCGLASASSVNRLKQTDTDNVSEQLDYFLFLLPSHRLSSLRRLSSRPKLDATTTLTCI
jgi:hypothetical protein